MTDLMIRNSLLFAVGHNCIFLLIACDDDLNAFLEV